MGGGEELTRKIFRSILTVGVAVLACSLLLVMGCFYSFYEGMQEHQLGDELRIAAAAVETNGSTYLEKIKSDRFRVTWIASDGTVLYDTQADAAQMENHLEREEVREALETGTGSSSRYSATLLQKTVYSASRLTDGTVLRLSASRATMGALLLGAFQPILLVVIVLLVLSSLLASRLAKRIVEPLNALDLEHPLENDAYEELSPLLRRIDRQRRQIDAQLAELRQKTDEFTQITAGMNEGLVLLDEKGAVLNINPAAQTLFGVTGACVGQDFLTVDREHSMSLALRTAMTDGHSEVRAERGGREYQFDLSRIESDGKVVGAANVGQAFTDRVYFWGRPSCAGDGYDASSSAGSNKGPTNEEYLAEVETRIDTFLVHHPYLERKDVPAEMVTASGSGLDPDITPESAYVQVKRVAAARNMDETTVKEIVDQTIEKPFLGLFGTEKVNVLKLNINLENYENK